MLTPPLLPGQQIPVLLLKSCTDAHDRPECNSDGDAVNCDGDGDPVRPLDRVTDELRLLRTEEGGLLTGRMRTGWQSELVQNKKRTFGGDAV